MIATREQLVHLLDKLGKRTRANGCTADEEQTARTIARKLRATYAALLASAPAGLVYTPAARMVRPSRLRTEVTPAPRSPQRDGAVETVRAIERERVREERRFWRAAELRRLREEREWFRSAAGRESSW